MAEDPQPLTLRERIQALNAAHIGRIPGEPPRPSSHPPPPVPSRRPVVLKQNSVNNPPERLNGSITDSRPGNLPAPPPPPAKKQPPPLPSRNTSLEDQRRGSIASTYSSATSDGSSIKSTTTRTKSTDSVNRIKAPAWGECPLPVLPPRNSNPPSISRKESDETPRYVNRAPTVTPAIIPALSAQAKPASPARPALPPRLPSRKNETAQRDPAVETPAVRKMPPMPSMESIEMAKKAAFSSIASREQPNPQEAVVATETVPQPTRQTLPLRIQQHAIQLPFLKNVSIPSTNPLVAQEPPSQPLPPPVPVSSRPDITSLQASKPRFAASTAPVHGSFSPAADVCLVCRDFSGPDHQATLFPRSQVTSIQTLAHQLTSPFPSPTDKARAIFTWLHHNINYDVVSFFNHCVKPSTPQSTLQSGLAVCEGYASLFTNLATYAGLESVVIGGHGKGYGFNKIPAGHPLPPYSAGHAWNAVKIDNGEWKLIDACWGAGHVQGPGQPYIPKFSPECFAMSNEEFGIKHFPENKDYFFLPGGRRLSWEEYIVIDPACWPDMVEGPTIFTNAKEDYFIGEKTVYPRTRKINVRQPGTIRFQFGLRCAHWSLDRHTTLGPPPVFLVSIGGADGRNKDLVPMEYYPGPAGQGGDLWCVDIPALELGAAGQTVTVFAVTSFGDRRECRGLTVREFREGKGRVGMGFTGVAAWDLV